MYALELAARYARSTLLVLEPNRSVWEQHTALATRSRRAHLAVLNTAVNEEVAEALAHSNEFLDMQLLIGLQSSRPFDHGVSVSVSKREALDRFVAHLLSMARRTLVMLPVATARRDECRDNRLANWVDGAPAARLEAAAATLKLRLHAQQHGQSAPLAAPELGSCASSRGVPRGAGQLGTPRERLAHWAPRHWAPCHCLSARAGRRKAARVYRSWPRRRSACCRGWRRTAARTR